MARMHTELLLLLLIAVIISAAGAAAEEPEAAQLPPLRVSYPVKALATIFSNLGFQQISAAAAASNLSLDSPITVFAPPDDSSDSKNLNSLLEEHSVHGLHPFDYLRCTSNFYTEFETLAPRRCLRVSFSYRTPPPHDSKVFVNKVEISQPDLFNNGLIIVHGLLRGGISTYHCDDFIPQLPRPISFPYIMPLMLTDAIIRLHNRGYNILALALRLMSFQLSELKSVTVFAIHDYAGGINEEYTDNWEFHIVPNMRILSDELARLPVGTLIPTMDEHGHKLVVTNSSEINYVKIGSVDLLHNSRVVVHDISAPFTRIDMDHNGFCNAHSVEEIKKALDFTRRALVNQPGAVLLPLYVWRKDYYSRCRWME